MALLVKIEATGFPSHLIAAADACRRHMCAAGMRRRYKHRLLKTNDLI